MINEQNHIMERLMQRSKTLKKKIYLRVPFENVFPHPFSVKDVITLCSLKKKEKHHITGH